MRKIILLLALTSFAVACKKDLVCDCTVTLEGTLITRTQTTGVPPLINGVDTTTSQPLFAVNTQKKTYNKVREKDMRKTCAASTVETVNQNSYNVVPGIYTITTNQTGNRTYNCTIK